jgi:DNA-binding transcriptional regulator GbsR (MarR family)
MELAHAKSKYLETWGSLATHWGINRTMAQIHALLLVAPEPMSAENIMDQIQVSRGNTNMNLRALMEWGIVEKKLIPGERREFFAAKKDIWQLFKQIAKERRRREIEPVISVLDELKTLEDNSLEGQEFQKIVTEIASVTKKLNKIVDLAIQSDEHWLMGKMTDILK